MSVLLGDFTFGLKLSQLAERKFGLSTHLDQRSTKLRSKYVLRPNFHSANWLSESGHQVKSSIVWLAVAYVVYTIHRCIWRTCSYSTSFSAPRRSCSSRNDRLSLYDSNASHDLRSDLLVSALGSVFIFSSLTCHVQLRRPRLRLK